MFRPGWIPDVPDQRDHIYSIPITKKLVDKVDLSGQCQDILNQGDLGSCTSNAIADAHRFCQNKQRAKSFLPSRLFIYYNERVMEDTVKSDSGAMIRDGVKSVAKQGVPPEIYWPYIISKFTKKPTVRSYKEALKHQSLGYERITSLNSMKACLADGYPFVFGFSVYESFMSEAVAKTGLVGLPSKSEQLLGGHCTLAVGYDEQTRLCKVKNSWGADWADHGYFYLPYDYIANPNLADDFWTIRLVEV